MWSRDRIRSFRVTNTSVQNMSLEYDGSAREGNMFAYEIVFTEALLSYNDIPTILFLTNRKDRGLIRLTLIIIINNQGDRT